MSKKWDKVEFSANFVGDGFLLAARRLREIQDDAPEEFGLVAEFLKIGYRKALYLAQIDRTFRELGADSCTPTAVGWTKLQMLCGYVTKDNCHQLLEIAGNTNVQDFETHPETRAAAAQRPLRRSLFLARRFRTFFQSDPGSRWRQGCARPLQ